MPNETVEQDWEMITEMHSKIRSVQTLLDNYARKREGTDKIPEIKTRTARLCTEIITLATPRLLRNPYIGVTILPATMVPLPNKTLVPTYAKSKLLKCVVPEADFDTMDAEELTRIATRCADDVSLMYFEEWANATWDGYNCYILINQLITPLDMVTDPLTGERRFGFMTRYIKHVEKRDV
jgi:hypothetical protein